MTGSRWAEIDLGAIRHNARRLVELAAGARLIAVVKADGYGHGAVPAARAALKGGAWGLAVSTLEEAIQLRGLVEPERLLALGALVPAQAPAAAGAGCAVICSTRDLADALAVAANPGAPIQVHLKVDTGMGRLGCLPAEAAGLARFIASSSRLRLAGVCTHLVTSESDAGLTHRQFTLFQEVLGGLGVEPGLRHVANSSALLRHPEMALDAVRSGIALYGCADGGEGWRPALQLRSLVAQLKELPVGATVGYGATWRAERPARVAAVAIGYADGVHRSRSNRGEVLVAGRRVPLVGRVSMDTITLDVSDAPTLAIGDRATLIGRDGEGSITAGEVAGWSGTISYEVLTSIGTRVERVYTGL